MWDHSAAMKKGWVRFIHQDGLWHGPEANYEYHDRPQARKLVAAHLRDSGHHLKHINLDVHHVPVGKMGSTSDKRVSHTFDNAGDALKHLGESALVEYEFGFLRHGKPTLKKYGMLGGNDHTSLAQHLGYKANATGGAVDQAMKAGHVRYWHRRLSSFLQHTHADHASIGYEFHDTPHSRNLVKKHLNRSGGATEIRMDIHEPQSGQMKCHKFRSVEGAQKHLNEATVVSSFVGFISEESEKKL